MGLRNDNIGALTLFSAVKGRSPTMNLLAREYALDIGTATYEPDIIEHIPGITNVIADALSRRTDPECAARWTLPTFLSNAKKIEPPVRDRSWWRTLLKPGKANMHVFWGSQA